MLGHWYTLLLLPDDGDDVGLVRKYVSRASLITTQVSASSPIATVREFTSALDPLLDAPP